MQKRDAEAYTRVLVSKGFKKTKTRLVLVDAIASRTDSFSAKDIHEQIPPAFGISFSTVFRNFQAFAQCGILHAVGNEGKFIGCCAGVESHQLQQRHTLYRCLSCAFVQEDVDTVGRASKPKNSRLATIESTVTEIVGRCSDCAE